jgi:Mg-chelatase subunit ChlI
MNSIFPELDAPDQQLSGFDLDSYQPMPVALQMRGAILRRLKAEQPVLPGIDGREDIKADVVRTLLSGAHLYLVSEEGTGKTRLSKSLTRFLPGIPVIKGCPYNDDPKWPHELLCPRCRTKGNPARDFGIDFIPSSRRFSRIQGNEYTSEAKLLGLKDIQSIAHGKSLSDPEAFTGTGVFRANRGLLFVDELPAIRTKIQVLFHPILEEKLAVLEEYNWQYPLDLVFVATGNPTGFAHVNDMPRPLLDRLELVYMDLPDEEVERNIILAERFSQNGHAELDLKPEELYYFQPDDISRKVMVPWWIMDMVNRAVRHSRICPYVEKRPSIRATIRALDHTCASVEIENKSVANLRHAFYGLRLALRGRIGLRADLIDFEEPRKAYKLSEQLTRDFLWNAIENTCRDAAFLGEWDKGGIGKELDALLSSGVNLAAGALAESAISQYHGLVDMVQRMKTLGREKVGLTSNAGPEAGLYNSGETTVNEGLNYSAIEMLANICVHAKTLGEQKAARMFIPNEYV